jgi:hypothetical protein
VRSEVLYGAGLAGQAVEGKTVPNQALTRAVLCIAETFRLTEMNFPADRCLN